MNPKNLLKMRAGMTTVHTALGLGVLLGVVGICYLLISHQAGTPVTSGNQPTSEASPLVASKNYSNSKYGFSLDYPAEFTVSTNESVPSESFILSLADAAVAEDYGSTGLFGLLISGNKIDDKIASYNKNELYKIQNDTRIGGQDWKTYRIDSSKLTGSETSKQTIYLYQHAEDLYEITVDTELALKNITVDQTQDGLVRVIKSFKFTK